MDIIKLILGSRLANSGSHQVWVDAAYIKNIQLQYGSALTLLALSLSQPIKARGRAGIVLVELCASTRRKNVLGASLWLCL